MMALWLRRTLLKSSSSSTLPQESSNFSRMLLLNLFQCHSCFAFPPAATLDNYTFKRNPKTREGNLQFFTWECFFSLIIFIKTRGEGGKEISKFFNIIGERKIYTVEIAADVEIAAMIKKNPRIIVHMRWGERMNGSKTCVARIFTLFLDNVQL